MPSVDGWTVERVVRHVGKVHQWVVNILAGGRYVDITEAAAAAPGLPKGADCLPAYRETLDAC